MQNSEHDGESSDGAGDVPLEDSDSGDMPTLKAAAPTDQMLGCYLSAMVTRDLQRHPISHAELGYIKRAADRSDELERLRDGTADGASGWPASLASTVEHARLHRFDDRDDAEKFRGEVHRGFYKARPSELLVVVWVSKDPTLRAIAEGDEG